MQFHTSLPFTWREGNNYVEGASELLICERVHMATLMQKPPGAASADVSQDTCTAPSYTAPVTPAFIGARMSFPRGAGTSPGRPVARRGRPAAPRPLERGGTDRSAGCDTDSSHASDVADAIVQQFLVTRCPPGSHLFASLRGHADMEARWKPLI